MEALPALPPRTAEIQVSSVKLVLSGRKSTLEGAVLGSLSREGEGEDRTGPLCCRGMGGTRALYQALAPEGPDLLGSCKEEQTPKSPSLWSFTPDSGNLHQHPPGTWGNIFFFSAPPTQVSYHIYQYKCRKLAHTQQDRKSHCSVRQVMSPL